MRLGTPVAIIIAGVIIAGAVVWTNRGNSPQNLEGEPEVTEVATEQEPKESVLSNVTPISDEDFVRGNEDASVVVYEYSDFECPFCKRFHDTMKELIAESGDSVAWVYRHFPLESLHPVKAHKAAVASECAALQGGEEAFWNFTDRYYELSLSNNQTNQETVLPQIVTELGLNSDEMFSCIQEGRTDDEVKEDFDNAVATGGRGTPWGIVVGPRGAVEIPGAVPLAQLKQLIESVK